MIGSNIYNIKARHKLHYLFGRKKSAKLLLDALEEFDDFEELEDMVAGLEELGVVGLDPMDREGLVTLCFELWTVSVTCVSLLVDGVSMSIWECVLACSDSPWASRRVLIWRLNSIAF